jgi:hypothetical protein
MLLPLPLLLLVLFLLLPHMPALPLLLLLLAPLLLPPSPDRSSSHEPIIGLLAYTKRSSSSCKQPQMTRKHVIRCFKTSGLLSYTTFTCT